MGRLLVAVSRLDDQLGQRKRILTGIDDCITMPQLIELHSEMKVYRRLGKIRVVRNTRWGSGQTLHAVRE